MQPRIPSCLLQIKNCIFLTCPVEEDSVNNDLFIHIKTHKEKTNKWQSEQNLG